MNVIVKDTGTEIFVPEDLVYVIMNELSGSDLISFCGVEKGVSKVCDNEMFWERKFEEDFPNDAKTAATWRQSYVDAVNREIQAYYDNQIDELEAAEALEEEWDEWHENDGDWYPPPDWE